MFLLLPCVAGAGIISGDFSGWTTISNLPEARQEMAAALVGSEIFAIGGEDAAGDASSSVWKYDVGDPTAGWVVVSNLPAARRDASAAVLGSDIYLIAGHDGTNRHGTVWVYDTTDPASAWQSISNLPVDISGQGAALANGKVYAAGGWTTGPRADVYEYDSATPTAGWQSVSNLPDTAAGTAMVELDGLLYVAGGRNSGGSQSTNVYMYDPTSPAAGWQEIPGLLAGRRRHGMGVANGRIIVMGGEAVGGSPTRTSFSFNPDRPGDGWQSLSDMPTCGEHTIGASDGERVFGLGGLFGGTVQDGVCEATYDTGVSPAIGPFSGGSQVTINGIDLGNGSDITNVTLCGAEAAIVGQNATQVVVTTASAITWGVGHVVVVSTSQGTSLRRNAFEYRQPGWIGGALTHWGSTCRINPRARLAAVTVTGHVWAIGGMNTNSEARPTVWEHHQSDGGSWWSSRDPMPSNRMDHAAVTVDKKVYVLGGHHELYGTFAGCWVYDTESPGLGWQSISNLPADRMNHGAAVVDGRIYVAGGYGPDGGWGAKKTVWRYDTDDPSAGWTSVSNLPASREMLGVAVLNGHVYAVGGRDGASRKTAWQYNPAMPENGWTSISNLPANRHALGLTTAKGRLFAMAGTDGSVPERTVYSYDPVTPEEGWSSCTNLPAALIEIGATALGNELFVVGGRGVSGAWYVSPTVSVGQIAIGVSPAFGPLSGGTEVTVIGGNLGSGSDITNVTLCGVDASILSQSDTQVVVQSGVSLTNGTGDVTIFSETIGITVASDAFNYRYPKIKVFDWKNEAFTNDEPASVSRNTDLQGVLLSNAQPCLLTLHNTGAVRLDITGVATNGAGADLFVVHNCPTSIAGGGSASITAEFTPTNFGMVTAVVSFVSTATNSPFLVNFSGYGMDISAENGPLSGGNVITIYGSDLGNGSDITNVTICGVGVVSVVSQTATSVTVQVAAGSAGVGDVVIQSTTEGSKTITSGYTYNPRGYVIGELNQWIAVSNLPAKRYGHGSASVGSRLFAYGGRSPSGVTNTTFEYDTAHPESGWLIVSNMLAKRSEFAAAATGGKIYCAGGGDGNLPKKRTYVYDPSTPEKGWTRTNDLQREIGGNSGAASGSRFYSVGGTLYDGGWKNQAAFYEYDTADPNPAWTQLPDMPKALDGPGFASLDGKLYVVAGERNGQRTEVCYAFAPNNPGAGWTTISNLPSARRSHAAVSAYGCVYSIGGDGADAAYSPRVYEYNPADPEEGWKQVQNLPSGRRYLAAATISNIVYITGGQTSAGFQKTAYKSGFAPGITPQYGTLGGGITVTLSGVNLGNGTDITNVTLAGITVTSIDSQSPTQVVVTAAAAPAPTSGVVAVYSVSHGVALSIHDFTYEYPDIVVLGANEAVVENGEAASYDAGTDYSGLTVGASVSHELYVSNYTHGVAVTVSSVSTTGAGAASFTVEAWPGIIDPQTRSNWWVRFAPVGVGVETAVVSIVSDATNSPYLVNLRGVGCALSTNIGPNAGGNTLVIDGAEFGDGADITNVTLCGVAASIVSQSATQLVVTPGPSGSGLGDILIHSTSAGTTVIPDAYTYNPAGYIYDDGELMGWQSISNLPAARNNLAAAGNGKVYAIGGDNSGAQADVYEYDPRYPRDGWASVSNLPVPLRTFAAQTVGGEVYAIGGYYTSRVDTVYAYDPSQPGAGWRSVSNLPAPVINNAAGIAGDYLYSVAGKDASVTGAVHRYDVTQPEAGWTVSSNLPIARDRLAVASLGGMLYAIGGADGAATRTNVYTMNGASPDGWTEIAGLPEARRVLGAATVHGRVFAIGGRQNDGTVRDTVYEYDPQTPVEGWQSAPALPNPRANLAAVVARGRIYAIGGQNASGNRVRTVYESMFTFGVLPAAGRSVGGDTIVISGTNLGDGGDITNVYLCGMAANAVISQSATQVVVATGASGGPQTGDVQVCSVSFGTTTKSNAYRYMLAYVILAESSGSGTLDPSGQLFVSPGGNTAIVARADTYFRIGELLTNGAPDVAATDQTIYTSVWDNVTADGTATVAFVADLADLGTPHWWLAMWGLTNGGASFDEAETNDTDNDALSAHDERIADTCPTNGESFFHLTDIDQTNSFAVEFACTNSRIYSLQFATNMVDGSWLMVDGQTSITGDVSGVLSLTDTNDADHRAYRVGVACPP